MSKSEFYSGQKTESDAIYFDCDDADEAFKLYIKYHDLENKKYSPPTVIELEKLYNDFKSGDADSKEIIIESHLCPTAKCSNKTIKISYTINNPSCWNDIKKHYIDVIQSGNEGLLYSIKHWNFYHNNKKERNSLINFSYPYIQHSVRDYINNTIIYYIFSEDEIKKLYEFRKLLKECKEIYNDDQLTPELISAYSKGKYTVSKVGELLFLNSTKMVDYVSDILDKNKNLKDYDFVDYDDKYNDLNNDEKDKEHDILVRTLDKYLDPKTALILKMRHGLYIKDVELSDREIACKKEIQLSVNKVQEIIIKGTRKLKECVKKAKLK